MEGSDLRQKETNFFGSANKRSSDNETVSSYFTLQKHQTFKDQMGIGLREQSQHTSETPKFRSGKDKANPEEQSKEQREHSGSQFGSQKRQRSPKRNSSLTTLKIVSTRDESKQLTALQRTTSNNSHNMLDPNSQTSFRRNETFIANQIYESTDEITSPVLRFKSNDFIYDAKGYSTAQQRREPNENNKLSVSRKNENPITSADRQGEHAKRHETQDSNQILKESLMAHASRPTGSIGSRNNNQSQIIMESSGSSQK